MMAETLSSARKKIDAVDKKLASLFISLNDYAYPKNARLLGFDPGLLKNLCKGDKELDLKKVKLLNDLIRRRDYLTGVVVKRIKSRENLAVKDAGRERQILDNVKRLCIKKGVKPGVYQANFRLIMNRSKMMMSR